MGRHLSSIKLFICFDIKIDFQIDNNYIKKSQKNEHKISKHPFETLSSTILMCEN